MSTSRRIARVVLDSRLPQLNRLFDYLIPSGMDVEPGIRVRVPLRSAQRLAEGYVVECTEESAHTGSLAEISEVVSPVPVMPDRLWRVASQVAHRSAGAPADVLRLAIPKRYVRVEKEWWAEGAVLDNEGDRPPGPESKPAPEPHEKVLRPGSRTSLSLPYGVSAKGQQSIPFSLEKVATLAVDALATGASVVIICPDWRDIQWVRLALDERVDERWIAELSGDQPPALRYQAYLRCLEPSPVIVLGSRHAVYAPAHNLGLILVIDDADSAHREPLAPYPHTRDVALVRNSVEGIAVCFASVTPSLAVSRWIDMGYVEEVFLGDVSRPRVIPSSLALHHDSLASPARLPSTVYQAVKKALESGPVLVQVFRSGYAPGLSCSSCGSRASCAQCGGPLRKTSANSSPSCLWCGVSAARWSCVDCKGSQLKPRGQAIGRTISDLGKSFPSVPVLRADGDNAVASVPRTPALIVATRGAEPIVAGGYSLVLLLDGAAMLQRDSLGALEETILAWERAISLASADGVCYVTDLEGPPALALGAGNWTTMVRHELAQRADLGLPPALRIASIMGPSGDVEKVRESAEQAVPQVEALGPVPLPEGGVLVVLRFPYSVGEQVVTDLAASRQKLVAGSPRDRSSRLRIVVDDALALDALVGE